MLRLVERTSGGGGRPFKPHPLADYLWRAIYPRMATSREQIRERMSKLSREQINATQVGAVMDHVWRNMESYKWMIAPAQKGAGTLRAYFPILIDPEDVDEFAYEESCREYVTAGLISQMRTIISMQQHVAKTIEIFAETAPMSRKQRRVFREARAAVGIAQRALTDALGDLSSNGA